MYNYFINRNLRDIYVWLSFDDRSVDLIHDQCVSLFPISYTVGTDDLEGGFDFNY